MGISLAVYLKFLLLFDFSWNLLCIFINDKNATANSCNNKIFVLYLFVSFSLFTESQWKNRTISMQHFIIYANWLNRFSTFPQLDNCCVENLLKLSLAIIRGWKYCLNGVSLGISYTTLKLLALSLSLSLFTEIQNENERKFMNNCGFWLSNENNKFSTFKNLSSLPTHSLDRI